MQTDPQTSTLGVCEQFNKSTASQKYTDTEWFTKEIIHYTTYHSHNNNKPTFTNCYKWLQAANCEWKQCTCGNTFFAITKILDDGYNANNMTNCDKYQQIIAQRIKRIQSIISLHEPNENAKKNHLIQVNINSINNIHFTNIIKENNSNNADNSNNSNNVFGSINIYMSSNTIIERANNIAGYLWQRTNFTSVLKILDKVSTHPAMPPGLQGFKIGDCVGSVIQVRDTYTKLAPKSDIDSVKQKRIISSSLTLVLRR